ncbi:unnamed protein product [Arabis nemorensis]|uniref:Uncharacterized protein n=1 Tax=Arabis nemorensis TaxID=586526 RepID=A0A565C434_9BRAS|nr:unnamed protein product [Arabis nemorensis]
MTQGSMRSSGRQSGPVQCYDLDRVLEVPPFWGRDRQTKGVGISLDPRQCEVTLGPSAAISGSRRK